MFFDLEQDERTAVKTAVALATSRFNDTIGKFVQRKADRLSMVEEQVGRIARECAETAKADPEEVEKQFRLFLSKEVAVSEPERVKVDEKGGTETENSDEVPQGENSVRDDVKASEPVLDDMPEQVNLADESSITSAVKEALPQASNCPYCGHTMTPVQNAQNPAASGQQQQCPNCGASIQATPGGQPGFQQGMQTGLGGGLYSKTACERCETDDAQENSILCEACNEFVLTGQKQSKIGTCAECGKKDVKVSYSAGYGFICDDCGKEIHEINQKYPPEERDSKKEATEEDHLRETLAMLQNQLAIAKRRKPRDVSGSDAQAPARQIASIEAKIERIEKLLRKEAQGNPDEEVAQGEEVQSPAESDSTEENLPPAATEDSNGPAEVYTGVVEETANINAAMAWSTPGDQDIQQISEQYGLDPDEVRANLRIVADFGDALAVNGDPNADPNVDGLQELPNFGGRIPTTEEEVDVDNAIQHTSDQTNLSYEDVYALVKESYGGDLGGQHYVSVSGEAHYYLPQELLPRDSQPDVDQPTESPQEALVSSVPAHLQSLAAYLEWENRQQLASA